MWHHTAAAVWNKALALTYFMLPYEEDQTSVSQLYLLIYGTRYLPLHFAEPLQSKHIYCNKSLVKKRKKRVNEYWFRAAQILSSSVLELLSRALPGNPNLRGQQISRQQGERDKAVAPEQQKKQITLSTPLSVSFIVSYKPVTENWMWMEGIHLRLKV